jgi:DNA-binding NarL/FixJ family response regulator
MNTTPADGRRRIFLIDDHVILLTGLKHLLGTDPSLEVCGQAANAKDALAGLENVRADLAIVDITMPGMNGIELTKNLHCLYPEMKILILSMHDESLYGERAVRAGASGYVMKDSPLKILLTAIHKVLQSEIFLSPVLSKKMLERMASSKDSRSELESLTDRELELVQAIGQGLGSAEIAIRMGISIKTVEAHRSNIRKKLNLPSNPHLVRFSMSHIRNPF